MEPQIMHRGNKRYLTEQWYQAAGSAPLLSGERRASPAVWKASCAMLCVQSTEV